MGWAGVWIAAGVSLQLTGCGPTDPDEPGAGVPDLRISEERLQSSLAIEWVEVAAESCNLVDACVAGPGWRRLVRADIEIQNVGDGPLHLGSPSDGAPHFEDDTCRARPGLQVAPALELFDADGARVRSGRARSACWHDAVPIDDGAPAATFDASGCHVAQGISPGWAHLSERGEDCQALDVTDLPPGTYRLRVTADPDRLLETRSGDEAVAEAWVTLSSTAIGPICVGQTCYVPDDSRCDRLSCAPTAPARICEGSVVVEIERPGLCHPTANVCVIEREEIADCADAGEICHDGECVDLCGPVDCGSEERYCADASTLVHVEPGTCDAQTGTCSAETIHEMPCEAGGSCQDGVCVPPEGLPDLTVDAARLTHSHYVEWQHFEPDACALEHGCIETAGWRRLMRFSTVIENRGTAPAHIGAPSENPDFVYDECRRQYQWQNDTLHELLTTDGQLLNSTRKKSFCLYDVHPIPGWPDPPEAEHPASDETCRENQGITHGWVDVYHHTLHCQWVDVTDVPPGDYILRVTVNTERLLDELDFGNNTVEAPVEVPPTDGPPDEP
jgi:hypothetical protein